MHEHSVPDFALSAKEADLVEVSLRVLGAERPPVFERQRLPCCCVVCVDAELIICAELLPFFCGLDSFATEGTDRAVSACSTSDSCWLNWTSRGSGWKVEIVVRILEGDRNRLASCLCARAFKLMNDCGGSSRIISTRYWCKTVLECMLASGDSDKACSLSLSKQSRIYLRYSEAAHVIRFIWFGV